MSTSPDLLLAEMTEDSQRGAPVDHGGGAGGVTGRGGGV